MKHGWTAEKLRTLSLPDLKSLRDNAIKKDAQEIVALCAAELGNRNEPVGRKQTSSRSKPAKKAVAASPVPSSTYFVSEYHFVCRGDKGVRELPDGNFTTAAWAVSETVVAESLKHGAILALHEAKEEPSYRQGKIVSFERVNTYDGDQELRIGFLVESTPDALEWFGDGAGERGYRWAKIGARVEGGSGE